MDNSYIVRFIRKDGKPVTSAQVYAVICRYPSIFTKEAGRICVMV